MKMNLSSTIFAATIGLALTGNVLASSNPVLMQPVKSVYDHYLKIEKALANDSLNGVDEQAGAIAKAVRNDPMKMLPAKVAQQADKLGAAKDLKAARAAFKPLSASLIKYLGDHNAKDAYVQVYCPMAKASWLQADRKVKNPYLGKAESMCGLIKD
jgi:Protein of unknown function (DUF3347)